METLQQQKTPQKTSYGSRSSVSNAAIAYPSRTIVHAKLEMTQPCDHDELEADAAANDIVNGGKIRRKISNGSGSGTAVSPQVESQIAQLQGGGHAMPAGLRNMMENGFGRDFSQVRLHTDSQAADMSSSISARAFTHGNDIYFNRGQFSPNTSEGQRLVAHELTHVAQGTGKVGREPIDPDNDNKIKIQEKIQDIIDKYKEYILKYENLYNKYILARDLKSAKRINEYKKELEKGLERFINNNKYYYTGLDFSSRFIDLKGATPIRQPHGKLGSLGETWDDYQPQDKEFSRNMASLINDKKNVILVFSGHHYAQIDYMIGRFANSAQTKVFDIFELPGESLSTVRLIISTSCATTCIDENMKSLKTKCPNATILGFRKSAPAKYNELDIFKKEIDNNIKEKYVTSIDVYVNAWKKAAEKMKEEDAKNRMPAVWHINDDLEYYDGNKWKILEKASIKTEKINDGGNLCEVHH